MNVGLIKDRHNMPVDDYIFDTVGDPLNFNWMDLKVFKWIHEHQVHDRLYVYVSGLTAATASVVKVCYIMRIPLSLMHYNSSTNSYVEQFIR